MSIYREPEPIPDFVESGCDLLIEDFRDQHLIRNILRTWLRRKLEVEGVLFAMIDALRLDTTTNLAGLAILGAYVGESQRGRTLEQFRQAIKVRIRINRSRGKAEDLIEIAALFVSSFTFREYFPAAFIVTANQPADLVMLADALRRAKGAGISMQLEAATVPSDNLIKFGSALTIGLGQGAGSITSTVPYRTFTHVRTR